MSKLGRKAGGRNKGTPELIAKIRSLKASGLTYKQVAGLVQRTPEYCIRITSSQPKKHGACECCGRDCQCLHRHHTDYIADKVVNVCPTCHRSLHGKTYQDKLLEIEADTNLGRALSGLRLRAEISLRELARVMGVSHSFLSQLEHGKRRWRGNQDWEEEFRWQVQSICQFREGMK